jgi:hypothetical protein
MIKLKRYEKLPLSKSNENITDRMQSKYSGNKWTSNLEEPNLNK